MDNKIKQRHFHSFTIMEYAFTSLGVTILVTDGINRSFFTYDLRLFSKLFLLRRFIEFVREIEVNGFKNKKEAHYTLLSINKVREYIESKDIFVD